MDLIVHEYKMLFQEILPSEFLHVEHETLVRHDQVIQVAVKHVIERYLQINVTVKRLAVNELLQME